MGSIAICLLKKLGFNVIAISGKSSLQHDWLKARGASQVLSRDDVLSYKDKALAKPLFSAAIDTCGGDLISALLPCIKHSGAITTCGMVGGTHFKSSVFPFIIRNVNLLGIDSAEIPTENKQRILDRLSSKWALDDLETFVTDIGRSELSDYLKKILNGQACGRYRLNLNQD